MKCDEREENATRPEPLQNSDGLYKGTPCLAPSPSAGPYKGGTPRQHRLLGWLLRGCSTRRMAAAEGGLQDHALKSEGASGVGGEGGRGGWRGAGGVGGRGGRDLWGSNLIYLRNCPVVLQ